MAVLFSRTETDKRYNSFRASFTQAATTANMILERVLFDDKRGKWYQQVWTNDEPIGYLGDVGLTLQTMINNFDAHATSPLTNVSDTEFRQLNSQMALQRVVGGLAL